MLAFALASMLVTASSAAPVSPSPSASLKGQPTRFCRELGSAASRSQAILICRTRAEWRAWEGCNGATRYCPPKKRTTSGGQTLGRETAFPMNEDSRIVCRQMAVTGTRLKSYRACLPQREWERMWKDSAEALLGLQDRSTRADSPQ